MSESKYKFGDEVSFITSERPAEIIGIVNSGTNDNPKFLYRIQEWAGTIDRIPEQCLKPYKKKRSRKK